MNTLRMILRCCLIVAASLLVADTTTLCAQDLPFSITVEKPDRTLPPGGFTTYEVIVHNESAKELAIVAERTVNDLPDTSWHSSVCSEFNCYEEVVSLLPAERLAAGDSTYFKMHVTAGTELDDTATIMLRFGVEGSQEFVEQTFTIITVEPKPTVFSIVAIQKEMSAEIGGEVEFYVGLANHTNDLLEMAVRRVENNFPNSSWQSRLCVPDSCLPPSEVVTPAVTIEPQKAVYIRLRILAGSSGEGKVTLRFDAGEGVDPAYEQFIVSVAALGVEQQGPYAVSLPVYPNPARSHVNIPLPPVLPGAMSGTLSLYDERGGLVARVTTEAGIGSDVLPVDLAGVAPGAYRYVLSIGGRVQQGAIAVVR